MARRWGASTQQARERDHTSGTFHGRGITAAKTERSRGEREKGERKKMGARHRCQAQPISIQGRNAYPGVPHRWYPVDAKGSPEAWGSPTAGTARKKRSSTIGRSESPRRHRLLSPSPPDERNSLSPSHNCNRTRNRGRLARHRDDPTSLHDGKSSGLSLLSTSTYIYPHSAENQDTPSTFTTSSWSSPRQRRHIYILQSRSLSCRAHLRSGRCCGGGITEYRRGRSTTR
jgi:hypothetical protein